jgi:hypothetical protein
VGNSRFGTLHDLLARIGFDVEVKGFPQSGQGLGWFAPMSAIALLFVFARRRATDEDFLWRLAYVAGSIGARAAMKDINVLNQAKPALIATVEAWTPDDPTDLWAEAERIQGNPTRVPPPPQPFRWSSSTGSRKPERIRRFG